MFIDFIGSWYWAYAIFAWIVAYAAYRIVKREFAPDTQAMIEKCKPMYWFSLAIIAVLIYAYAFHAYNPPQTDFERRPDTFTKEQMEMETPTAKEIESNSALKKAKKEIKELKEMRDELREIAKDRDGHLKNLLKDRKESK